MFGRFDMLDTARVQERQALQELTDKYNQEVENNEEDRQDFLATWVLQPGPPMIFIYLGLSACSIKAYNAAVDLFSSAIMRARELENITLEGNAFFHRACAYHELKKHDQVVHDLYEALFRSSDDSIFGVSEINGLLKLAINDAEAETLCPCLPKCKVM